MKILTRLLSLALCLLLPFTLLSGCSEKEEESEPELRPVKLAVLASEHDEALAAFSDGIAQYAQEVLIVSNGDKLRTETFSSDDTDYSSVINILAASGYNAVIAVGDRFEQAIGTAQGEYPECCFCIIDGSPKNSSNAVTSSKNTLSVTYSVEQAGFLAGLASAYELKSGQAAFIGGAQNDSGSRYLSGFRAGLEYGKQEYGTELSIGKRSEIFLGNDRDAASAQQLAGLFYDSGARVIFAPCGDASTGVFSEAKARALDGSDVWCIGADAAQTEIGYYYGASSVTLLSAVRSPEPLVRGFIQSVRDKTFTGGTRVCSVADGSIVLPESEFLSGETKEVLIKALPLLSASDLHLLG